ncbi:hypothetical protein GALMADRAFT_734236 [Galerina marginata CBS 339.88]|uniref:DUF2415 domain-containing protein n=1 Tax=Galerina marginata (strain CBS 339.88) TaxID=685588 RepID=A0A067T193_GALM3|nr:hypothetical protein GALMADRAFT_734236 [Galerina marginata CBS 339.88]
MESSDQTWLPPQYDISETPSLASTLKIGPDTGLVGNFPRVAKWSPDGSVVLAQCENRTFQFFDATSQGSIGDSVAPIRAFPQAAPILDFVWYPTATPHNPAAFCFVASIRECPVKLLDASDGRLRASYRIVDHRERQIAPHSLAFNLTAQRYITCHCFFASFLRIVARLYCGFEDAIEIFDLSRPGEGSRMHTTPSKKSKDGLKGIISSIAFSPAYSPDECFYAAGSFSPISGNIAMFSDAGQEPLMFVGGGPSAGVTQLQFNPAKPHILYATYRGKASGFVYSWDIRSNVDVPLEVFQSSPVGNDSKTNQKIRFDVDLAGRFLSIGDQRGNISVFDLDNPKSNDGETNSSLYGSSLEGMFDTKFSQPNLQFKAHDGKFNRLIHFHEFIQH